MTKNKQPRDGNGKFTKTPMFSLHSKDGSVAYFTSVEEMNKFSKANGLGKPVIKESKKVKNPDCEPATKGYVKDLIRNTREHTHKSTISGFAMVVGLTLGWGATFITGIECLKNLSEHGMLWLGMFSLFSIAITIAFIEFWNFDVSSIKEYVTPKELQKYTPLRKDECEE